jgi:hypothetical protein
MTYFLTYFLAYLLAYYQSKINNNTMIWLCTIANALQSIYPIIPANKLINFYYKCH